MKFIMNNEVVESDLNFTRRAFEIEKIIKQTPEIWEYKIIRDMIRTPEYHLLITDYSISKLYKSMDSLTPIEKTVILLKFKYNLDFFEIGWHIHVSYGENERLSREILEDAMRKLKNRYIIHMSIGYSRELGIADDSEVKKIKKDFGDVPLSELNFSVRSVNALFKAGIKTLNDLTNFSIEELSKISNFGQRSVREVIKKLSEYDIYLPDKKEVSE